MIISEGLVGPKGIAKAELDGQMVNIPSLSISAMEGRSLLYGAHYWIWVRSERLSHRKIRRHIPIQREDLEVRRRKFSKKDFPEKLLSITYIKPYRKPTQVVRSRRPRRTS